MRKDFLFEIGVEEIPHTYLTNAMNSLKSIFEKKLNEYKLEYTSVKVFSTPRRLGILVKELEVKQKRQKIFKKGPNVSLAYDKEGNPTKVLLGFIKSLGISETDIKIMKENDKEFVYYESEKEGEETKSILEREIPKIISSLEFPKKMRWSDVDYPFVRPIRWIVALFGNDVIEITIAGINASNISKGHRTLGEDVTLYDPSEYEVLLESRGKVIVDPEKRKKIILTRIHKISETLDATPILSDELLEDLVNLTEYPDCALGEFSENFLKVPHEILKSEMIDHQKFIPLEKDGKLINKFIIVTNTLPNTKIVKGNERVLSARLNDGIFLYYEDLKKSIDYFVNKTKELVFFAEIGTILDKTGRMVKISEKLCDLLNISGSEKENIIEATRICKFDLTTGVVYEFPELQGIMGYHYALAFGKNEKIANYIKEHYKPVSQNDTLPYSLGSSLLSVVDKMDNIFSLYSAGQKVSGSSDPFGLRRQSTAIFRVFLHNKIDLDILSIFDSCVDLYKPFMKKTQEEIKQNLQSFILPRLKSFFKDMGFETDEIEATVRKTTNPYDAYLRINALKQIRSQGNFQKVAILFKRIRNILNEAKFTLTDDFKINVLLFNEFENKLYLLLEDKKNLVNDHMKKKNYLSVLELLLEFGEPVDIFFQKVFVMDNDIKLRNNRLVLLYSIYSMFEELVDFNAMKFE